MASQTLGWILIIVGVIIILDGVLSLIAFMGLNGDIADVGRYIRIALGGLVVYIGLEIVKKD